MNPGRDLDTLVGEKVMGWKRIQDGGIMWWEKDGKRVHPSSGYNLFPPYSTDIAAAWEVVEKMFTLGWDLNIELYKKEDVYVGPYYRIDFQRINKQEEGVIEFADTAPHAICLAALKAFGVEA